MIYAVPHIAKPKCIRIRRRPMSQKVTKPVKSGFLTCGICGARVIQGIQYMGFFCPDEKCFNSEKIFMAEKRYP
jgi:hypothetical protein